MPFGPRARAKQLQIREDLKNLTTDEMIFKYNREHYDTLKRQNGILDPPPVTKSEKKDRMNTHYGPPTPPSETTACDLWGVRLPLFKNHEMHNVNERFRQALYGPKRKARKPRRAVTDREVVKAKSRNRLLETAKAAAAGLTPPESDTSSVPPAARSSAAAQAVATRAEAAQEPAGVLRGAGRKRITEEEVVRTHESEPEPEPEPDAMEEHIPEVEPPQVTVAYPYGGPPPRRGPDPRSFRLRGEQRTATAELSESPEPVGPDENSLPSFADFNPRMAEENI